MSKLKVVQYISNIAKKRNKSLNLLKEKALKADLIVPDLVDQKLIRKKEVRPINSQPKKSVIKLPEETKRIILIINELRNNIKRSTNGSYLK
jgi:DNA integrity scanning protein DisA with diadenylate cyclase activity